jgi:acyl-CoA synthetase (AMP-forming)/AMP-acid ligase II
MVTPAGDAVVNIAACLPRMAARQPDQVAICQPEGRHRGGRVRYRRITYRELDEESDAVARGLATVGIGRGVHTALMVPPGPRFFSLAFGMAKAGVVPVLVDPGIGISSLGRCLAQAEPAAFIGTPLAQAARLALGWGRHTIRTSVTVGGVPLPGAPTLRTVLARGRAASGPALAPTRADEVAAILFTSGSTGTPKGAVYTHGNFAAQVETLRRLADLQPGEIDLPTFPPFALFDPALGMTTVVPRMDFTRPAQVDPAGIVRAIQDERVTNMFASPALLAAVARWGVPRGVKLPSLRRVISAGAPVPARVVEAFASLLAPGARLLTPYGATEALPVAVIEGQEILRDTRGRTEAGAGVCVGRPVEGMEVAIIPVSDDPLVAWDDRLRLPCGLPGEIAVRGPVVTRRYWNRDRATTLAKIPAPDGHDLWHRMGDIGYLDQRGRLWFCGRKSQRVALPEGRTLFTVPCEGVFAAHPHVRRAALVGARANGGLVPVVCVELEPEGKRRARRRRSRARLVDELLALGARVPHTAEIRTILFHPRFPVDIRHNAKIGREALAVWAQGRLR